MVTAARASAGYDKHSGSSCGRESLSVNGISDEHDAKHGAMSEKEKAMRCEHSEGAWPSSGPR
ncbi:MAG: hypothetical protein QHG99_08380, partial [Methanomicrobiales archaeon]|nr:hypothetical protein [Methanomicrobiales archaeon]